METHPLTKSFPLGETVITATALKSVHPIDVYQALKRHSECDWGDLDPQDMEENTRALEHGCRLLSAYRDRFGTKFWIITEGDRSATTILLPEDY